LRAIENFSAEGRAAVDYLKGFIREAVGTEFLAERALILAGLPQNHPEAKWHEIGTSRIPPRPFLSLAAMGQERIIHEMIADMMFGASEAVLEHAWHFFKHHVIDRAREEFEELTEGEER
jgi:hypothetical protein